jgi:hypothetical protein
VDLGVVRGAERERDFVTQALARPIRGETLRWHRAPRETAPLMIVDKMLMQGLSFARELMSAHHAS